MLEINPNSINRGRLTHLIADDLFTEDIKQVFHAKTGKHIGYIIEGQQIIAEETELQPEPEIKNINQLKLF